MLLLNTNLLSVVRDKIQLSYCTHHCFSFFKLFFFLQVKSLNGLSGQVVDGGLCPHAARAFYVPFKFQTSLSFTQCLLRKVKVQLSSIQLYSLSQKKNPVEKPDSGTTLNNINFSYDIRIGK